MTYTPKTAEDFMEQAEKISYDGYIWLKRCGWQYMGESDQYLGVVASQLADIYNQGFDDAIKVMGEIK